MDENDARKSIEEIRNVLARTTRFSRVAGWAWALSGFFAIGGALAAHLAPREAFVPIWGTVFAASVATHVVGMRRRGRSVPDPTFDRLLPQVLAAFGPAVAVGGILTLFCLIHAPAHDALVAPIWILCYGLGLLASSLIAVAEIRLAGAAFLACGALALFVWPDAPMAMMALSFGGIHIGFGLRLAATQARGD